MWVLTEAGKSWPFDLGFTVRELVRDPRTGARFAVLLKDDRHDCKKRKANNGSHRRKV